MKVRKNRKGFYKMEYSKHKSYNRLKKGNKKYFIPFILILLFIIVLEGMSYYKIHTYYVKVGDISLNKSEYNFFYKYTINNFESNYDTNSLGVDLTADLSEQNMTDDITWEEYFEGMTDMSVYETLTVLNEYSADVDADVDKIVEEIEEQAESAGVSVNTYIKLSYDSNITMDMVKRCLTYYLTYQDYLSQDLGITDEEYDEYYETHKDALDEVEYYEIILSADEINTLENLEINSEDDFLNAAISLQQSTGYVSVTGYSNCDSMFSEWVFNAKNGDTKIFSDDDYCYMLYKIDRHKAEKLTRNVNSIELTVDNDSYDEQYYNSICSLKEEFEQTDMTKEDFVELAETYAGTDGREENIVESNISILISSWLFDESTEHGDTNIIKVGDTYYFIYYDCTGLEEYKAIAKSSIETSKLEDRLSEMKQKYTYTKR
jgi:hypothetical protein